MVSYQHGKIYKILNDVNDKIYIGSTAQTLAQRMALHRYHAKIELFSSPFCKDMKAIGTDRFRIELIKNHPCINRRQLNLEESKVTRDFIENGSKVYNVQLGKSVLLADSICSAKDKMSQDREDLKRAKQKHFLRYGVEWGKRECQYKTSPTCLGIAKELNKAGKIQWKGRMCLQCVAYDQRNRYTKRLKDAGLKRKGRGRPVGSKNKKNLKKAGGAKGKL